MPGCTVFNCKNSNKKEIILENGERKMCKMFSFPKKENARALWIKAVNRPELKVVKYPFICEVRTVIYYINT